MTTTPKWFTRSATRPLDAKAVVTSVMVTRRGAHDRVGVWIDGKLTGELTVGLGEGELLAKNLGLIAVHAPDKDEP